MSANKIFYVNGLNDGYEICWVSGYVQDNMCNVFIRNSKYEMVKEFGIVTHEEGWKIVAEYVEKGYRENELRTDTDGTEEVESVGVLEEDSQREGQSDKDSN